MIIALPSKRQDAFSATMRRRLDALLTFLRWTATISTEPNPWGGSGCRFRVEREEVGFNWLGATYIIDAMPKRQLVRDKELSRRLVTEHREAAGRSIYGIMTEGTVVEQMAANMTMLAIGRLQPHNDDIMDAIRENELLPGKTMTRAVLEARLIRQGFAKEAVAANIIRMIGNGALSIDLNRQFMSGSLIWRRLKQERPEQFALPWVQARTYC